ncbi:MAG: DUF1697 domain-containing protein [Micropruina sp.]
MAPESPADPRHVAFFRNMNLGQARSHSPTRPVLEAAFERAGAVRVRSFQTNGTVLFDPLGRSAARVIADVRDTLAEQVGYTEIAPSQPLPELVSLVRQAQAVVSADEHRAITATFFEPLLESVTGMDWAAVGTRIHPSGTTVVASGTGWVVTRYVMGGDPTVAVQAQLGAKATTRTLGTVQRLLRAAATHA